MYEASSDCNSCNNDPSRGAGQKAKSSSGTLYILQQSSCSNSEGSNRSSECKRRVCPRLRRPVTISLLEAGANAYRECALRCFRRVSWHDHKKSLVLHAGGTQWLYEGDCAAGLGISGRLL